MGRVSLATADRLRTRCHELRASGYSIRQIASALDLYPRSVQNYLKVPPPAYTSEQFIADCLALKAVDTWRSPASCMQAVMLSRGSDYSESPASESLVLRAFNDKVLTKVSPTRNRGKDAHLFNAKGVNAMAQIDTVKLVLTDGTVVRFLTMIDLYSRAATAHYLPTASAPFVAGAVSLAVGVLGVPVVVNTDNGDGFSPQRYGMLTPAMAWLFKAGTQRIQFAPLGSPTHNAFVERLHRTLKYASGYFHTQLTSLDSAITYMDNAINEYNNFRHRGLGGRGRKTAKTPAGVHGSLRPVSCWDSLRLDIPDAELATTPGVISYLRYIRNGGLIVSPFPSSAWVLDHDPGAWLSRVDMHYGGAGSVTIYDGHPDGRMIGSFSHDWGNAAYTGDRGLYVVRVDQSLGFKPCKIDDTLQARQEHAALRKGSIAQIDRCSLGSGWRRIPDSHNPGEWLLVDSDGSVRWSSMSGSMPDHLQESM